VSKLSEEDERLLDEMDRALGGQKRAPLTPIQKRQLQGLVDGRWHDAIRIAVEVPYQDRKERWRDRDRDTDEYLKRLWSAAVAHNAHFTTNSPLPPSIRIAMKKQSISRVNGFSGTRYSVRAVPRDFAGTFGERVAEAVRRIEEWALQKAKKR
jgi:hypothetical protein